MKHVNIKVRAREADMSSPSLWDPLQDMLVSMVWPDNESEVADGPYILEGRAAVAWRLYCYQQASIRMQEILRR